MKFYKVTQTTLGGITMITIYFHVANFVHCVSATDYENWLTINKAIAVIKKDNIT